MTQISRRGFLGALAAFSAAVADGVKMPPSTSPLPPLPEQEDFIDSLTDCRVREYNMSASYLEPSYLEVEYVYAPDAPKSSLDEYVAGLRKSKKPVRVSETVGMNGARTVNGRFM